MRNTLFLYVRTFFAMIVSLYTTRIVIRELGIDDYGVYNVVGGFVGMFSIAVGPISNAISRFLTFELGKGNLDRLKITFSTSVNVQIGFGLIIIIIGETFGIWFLNYKLNIPTGSLTAANWVLQCSLISMVISLINVPFFSSIVAHEKLDAFAYMSILEVILKLLLALSLSLSINDKLILYSVGILVIGIIMRGIYGVYCTRKFEECHYELKFDKAIFKEMFGFAWWSFFGNTSYILNTQGVSMLMNIFFGVVMNTAKGIAMQVEGAVLSFVNSFMSAFNPQITKSYAENNMEYMYSVMCRGSKFSFYLLLLFLIPIEFEAPLILKLWLGEVPEYSVSFLRLSLISIASIMLGNPFMQGILATGTIKGYEIAVTTVGCLVFPLTWVAYKIGFDPEIFYWIYIFIYNVLIWIRMWFVRKLLGFKIKAFISIVFVPIIRCSLVAILPALCIYLILPESLIRLIILTLISLIATSFTVLYLGMTNRERVFVIERVQKIIR